MHEHDIDDWRHSHDFGAPSGRAEARTARVIVLTAVMMVVEILGGMASALVAPDQNRLLLGAEAHGHGAVGVLLQGLPRVRSIVSQGCRPIGSHMVVTKARQNVIQELGGQSPLARLQQLWPDLTPRDQKLVQEGLHVGRVINEYQDEFRRTASGWKLAHRKIEPA